MTAEPLGGQTPDLLQRPRFFEQVGRSWDHTQFRLAGELGLGILSTTLLSPVSVLETMLHEYEAGLAACTNPVGKFVNEHFVSSFQRVATFRIVGGQKQGGNVAAYFCAFDYATPLQVKAALVAALAYFVLPFDVVPDILPLVGYGDDAAVLVTALRMVAGHIRPEHREAARRTLAGGLDEAR